MGIETIIAGISLAVGVAGAGVSYVQQQSARKDAKKARALEQQRMEVEERRRRRQEIRQKRIVAAETLNFANQTGGGASSGPQGGLTSLSSQLGSSQGFASTVAGLNRGISFYNQRAEDKMGRAAAISGFTNTLSNGISAFGGPVANYFSSPDGAGASASTSPYSSPRPQSRPSYNPNYGYYG